MRTASIPARLAAPQFRSKRLLALAGDERLVEQIRRGNEAAFEVAFERHGAGILGFCRHMLGSPEEAEDVVQHTLAAAFRELRRDDRRAVATPEATNGGSTGGREPGPAVERANGAGPVGSEPAAGNRETEGRPRAGARAPGPGKASAPPPGQLRAVGGLRRGHGQRNGHKERGGAVPSGGSVEAPPVPKPGGRGPIEAPPAPQSSGRGPIETPPAASPVRRGPPEPKPGAAPSVKPKPAPGPELGRRAPAVKPASPAASRPVSPPPGQEKAQGSKAGSGG